MKKSGERAEPIGISRVGGGAFLCVGGTGFVARNERENLTERCATQNFRRPPCVPKVSRNCANQARLTTGELHHQKCSLPSGFLCNYLCFLYLTTLSQFPCVILLSLCATDVAYVYVMIKKNY